MAITNFPISTVPPTANIIANTPAGPISATNVQAAIDQLAALMPTGGTGGFVSPTDFGAIGDGNSHPITSGDIAAHASTWIGPYNQSPLTTYPVGTEWDYVGIQEAIYAAFASASTVGNVVWNITSGRFNRQLYLGPGSYRCNRRLWMAAYGYTVTADNRWSTRISWRGYSGLNGNGTFTCNSHSSTTLDGISAADIAQLFVGMHVRDATATQSIGSIPWGTKITAVGSGSVTLSNATTSTVSGLSVFVFSSLLQMDSCPYGLISNLRLDANAILPRVGVDGAGGAALLVIDRTISGLSPQQMTFVNMTIFGNDKADVGISIVPEGGGGSQGDTITFLNPFIGNCWRAGLRISGNNALNISLVTGDIQFCRYDGISCVAGSMAFIGGSAQNQLANFFFSPQYHQVALLGRDILANGPGGVGNASYVTNMRSEASVGVVCTTGYGPYVANYGLSGLDTGSAWTAANNYQLGDVIRPTSNNSLGRVFICVDAGADNLWHTVFVTGAGSSGDTIKVTGSPGWAVNQWVGYALRFRFGSNGFTSNPGNITSSTADTITLTGAGLGNSCSSDTLVFIQGHSGGVQPNWDALAGAHWVPAGDSGQGFFANAATSTVTVGSAISGAIAIGDAIVVRDAIMVGVFNTSMPQLPYSLISKVTNKVGTLLTVTQPIAFGNATGLGTDGYYGNTVADGQVAWMEIPYAAHQGCRPLINVNTLNGVARGCIDVHALSTDRRGGLPIDNPGNITLSNSSSDLSQNVNLNSGPAINRLQQQMPTSTPLDLTNYALVSDVLEFVPTGNQTLNFPTPLGYTQELTLVFLTSGTTSFTITFGTNALSTGTLATGVTNDKRFVVRFVSDKARWLEVSRTGAL